MEKPWLHSPDPRTDPTAKAWWGQADLFKANAYLPNPPGGAIIEWSPTNATGNYYMPGGHVHLKSAALQKPHTILHEYAHNIMYNVYGNYLPPNDCPRPHYIQAVSAPTCAWVEGWANFFPLAVLNDTFYQLSSGASVDLQNPSWFEYNWDDGDQVEGRVAGALLDLMDADDDGYDWYSDGFNRLWATVYNHNSHTFAQFWNAWKASIYDQRAFRAAAFQNTIDYGYKPKITLTWDTDSNLDNHLWLPVGWPFHIFGKNLGNLSSYPWAKLDCDNGGRVDRARPALPLPLPGPTPEPWFVENIIITRPTVGTYVIAVNDPTGNVTGKGGTVQYQLGPYQVAAWTPPAGTGEWWYVADISGFTGRYTTRNTIQAASPAPY